MSLGCGQPPGVQHGELLNQTEANRGSFPPGTLLMYRCDPGYTADGSISIICTSSGAWSHQPPQCIKSNSEYKWKVWMWYGFTGHPSESSGIINSWLWSISACLPPTEPENGGYRCHPSPCHHFTHKTVIEYFCDEGYALKADYKFLTCQNGEWDSPMQITCRLTQGLFLAALSIIWCVRHVLWHLAFFVHRQGAVVSTGNTGSVNCGVDSQLSGSYPAFSGALCTCTAQTQVLSPEQVRYCMELFSNLLV